MWPSGVDETDSSRSRFRVAPAEAGPRAQALELGALGARFREHDGKELSVPSVRADPLADQRADPADDGLDVDHPIPMRRLAA
jgi:hypothetical protein